MNGKGDRATSELNQVPNYEENVYKGVSKQDENEKSKQKPLDNSAKFISNESSNGVVHMNNPKETVGSDAPQSNDDKKSGEVIKHEEAMGENAIVQLPDTTILLETKWGSKIYVVGTAHFSEQSQEDVAKVIRAVQPNFVVLELCESRSYMLKWEEEEILKIAEKMEFRFHSVNVTVVKSYHCQDASNGYGWRRWSGRGPPKEMVREAIRTYGVVQGVMYLLLLSVSAQITRELGMAPGGEFRRSFKEALNVPGCIIHLGDRPIEITLRRAFASLSWWQSIKFAFYVIFSKKKIDADDIEKCKNRDYLEEMLAMLGGEFPELKNVFVNERDFYLSYSLVNASALTRGPHGIVPNVVVGVVGMGHVAGIQRNWGTFDPMELQRVLQIPPPSRISKVIKFTLKTSILILALYGMHKLVARSKFSLPLRR